VTVPRPPRDLDRRDPLLLELPDGSSLHRFCERKWKVCGSSVPSLAGRLLSATHPLRIETNGSELSPYSRQRFSAWCSPRGFDSARCYWIALEDMGGGHYELAFGTTLGFRC